MPLIIGIDMGTTNSAVARATDDGVIEILGPDDQPTISSTVRFDGESFVVGPGAAAVDAESSFPAIKRILGRKAQSAEIALLARTVPYRVAASPTGDAWVRVGERPTPPQELAGALLRALRARAEDAIGEPVTRAVLAVPAYFDDAQRQAVRDAGRIAGLEVVRLINEPTAAALAYGVPAGVSTIAVFDLGGGTFDVSILRVEDDVFTVLASHGDASLGGDDWDQRILERLLDDLFSSHQFDATNSPGALASLRDAAERAKVELTSAETTVIALTIEGANGEAIDIERSLDRDELERETRDLCDRFAGPCRLALRDAEIDRAGIDAVLLVGGMTRAPMVRRAVSELLGEPRVESIDPATAVASGAAAYAAILAGSDAPTTLLDVSSHTLGVRVGDIELPGLLRRGEELPARAVVRFEVPARIAEAEPDSGGNTITIELYRGESQTLENNTEVGRVLLDLDRPDSDGAPAVGAREIELTVSIDVNSIVGVKAIDVATGATAYTRLRTRGALLESQLVRIVRGVSEPTGDSEATPVGD